jgi:hypothetical protein
VAPSQCSPDQYEPNDSVQVAFQDVAEGQAVSANLCGNTDVDRFSFDSAAAKGSIVRGTMLIDLVINPVDVGQGTATLTLTDQQGNILARQSTGRRGRVHMERALSAAEFDTFQLKVSGRNLNPAGLRYSLTAGIAPESVVRACTGAERIPADQNGGTVGRTTGNTQSGQSVELDASCIADGANQPESIYSFSLRETNYVTIDLFPQENVDLAVSLRRQCASFGSEMECANRAARFGNESIGRLLSPGTYTLVVQGARTGEAGQFVLTYEKEPVVCSASQNECTGPSSARVCRDNRTTFNEIQCADGCDSSIGRCNWSPGENCYEAIEVTGSSYSNDQLDWDNHVNSFEPTNGCVQDAAGDGRQPDIDGADTVYEVTLESDEVLDAELDVGSEQSSGALYLQGNCEDPRSTCVRASDTEGPGERLTYINESGAPKTYYLVADSARDTSGTGSISIKTGPRICQPQTDTCDGSVRKRCSESGIEYVTTQCQYGCNDGTCNPPPYDTCSGAVDLTGGGTVTHDWNQLNGDYNVPDSCAGDDTPGSDSVYTVDLGSDDVLTAEVTPQQSDGDPALYITSACGSNSVVTSSCLAGVDEDFGGDQETLNFRPPGDYSGTRTFYLFVDSDDTTGGFSGSNGPFTLDVSIQSPICTPGDRRCASGSTDTIEICGEFGLQYNQFSCQGSSPTCQSGGGGATCSEPSAEVCADPIKVDKNGSVSMSSAGSTNALELPSGTTGSCQLNSESRGDDQFFEVELSEDDLLTATLDSSESSAMLYIMDNCVVSESCQTANGNPSADQSLQYLADEDETVFVVVDSDSFGSFDGSYTLDMETTPNVSCVPNTYNCTSANQVSVCNAVGSGYSKQYSCSNGCSNGGCNPPTGSPPPQASCSTAPNIGSGTVIRDNWNAYTNNIDIPGSACGMASGGDGSESVYAVDVVPGEIVTASLERLASGLDDPVLYILGQCNNPNSHCLAGDSDQENASLTYTASNNTTLYIVADNDFSSSNSDAFRLEINKQAPTCSPGTTSCTSNNEGVRYCKSIGLEATYSCSGQCANGGCLNPTGNRCVDPIELTNGDTFTSSFASYDNNLAPDDAACGVLPGTEVPNGPDAVFEITGYSQGETMVATLNQAPDDVNMYVLESCPFEVSNPSGQCLNGVRNTNTLQHYFDSPGPRYLVVDSPTPTESQDFALSLSRQTGDVCQPGGGTCAGSQLSVCADDGDAVEATYSCSVACLDSGYCERPGTANSSCSTAHPVDGGTRLVDSFSRFNATLSPTCVTDNSSGKDAVYSLSVPAGKSVEATVTPLEGGADLSAYVLGNCTSPGNACLNQAAVTNDSDQTTAVTTGYKNSSSQSETVYIVVDKGSGPDVPFELEVDVRSPECTSNVGNQPTTCLDAETEGVCTSYELYRPQTCYFGCDSSTGACEPPPNEQCSGATSVSANNTYFGNIGSYTDDYDAASTSSGVSSCLSSGASAGPDAVYQVQLDSGDYFQATLDAPGSPVLWATTDCATAADSCVAGSNGGSGNANISFEANSTGTYFIMADTDVSSGSTNPTGQFELEVEFAGPPVCIPGESQCSSMNSSVIQYCTSPTSTFDSSCSGTCSNGECTQLHGDFCADAQTVTAGTSISYNASAYTNDYNLPDLSQCPGVSFSFSTGGNDKVFEITLNPGDTLDFNPSSSNSGDDLQVYIVEQCGTASTLQSSCVAAADSSAGSSETISFTPSISSPTDYFVVVDGFSSSLNTQGTITGSFTVTSSP